MSISKFPPLIVKAVVLSILVIPCSLPLLAQESGTVYFNETWEPCKKKQAFYYREWEEKGRLFAIKDYYVDGGLYETGQTKDIDCGRICNEGDFVLYNLKGNVEAKGNFVNGRKNGTWDYYLYRQDTIDKQIMYKNDTILKMTHFYSQRIETVEYENGIHTVATTYDSRRLITSKKTFKGSQTIETKYYSNSAKKCEQVYESDKLTKETCYDSLGAVKDCDHDTDGQVFQYVERLPMPTFDVGAYIGKNYHYPKKAKEQGRLGRVVVSFIVMEDGSIDGAYVSKSAWPDLDDEALRVIKMMPKWKPGQQNGKNVKVMYSQPFNLKLE